MPVPSLPNELFGIITSKIPRQDHHTLSSLALASRRFLPFARARPYYHLKIHAKWLDDKEFYQSAPHLTEEGVDKVNEELEESQEEWATRYFLHHFEPSSRKLLDTFMATPKLGTYVRFMEVELWLLNDPDDGVRLLRTMIAPSSNLQRLEVRSVGWGTEDGEAFDAVLAQLAPNLTELVLPGAEWTKRRLASSLGVGLGGFPELSALCLEEEPPEHSQTNYCRWPTPELSAAPFHLRTLFWEGYGVGEEEFRLVASASASTLEYLYIPIFKETLDLSSFLNLTILHIQSKISAGGNDLDVDVEFTRAIVATVRSCRVLTTLTVEETSTSRTSAAWETPHLLGALPSTLTQLDIKEMDISRPYLLTFLRNTSLAPELSELWYPRFRAHYPGWTPRGTSIEVIRAEEGEIERLCAERGIGW
ncbi:hypothetical protein BCR35DRAFT_299763 [Leucosporidium creatinivorum]|uniref:F-box domain-containing protein n=1 Tax=Leucosporidium creatinivorum TaxID=106004 RepID=A0A1Y2G0N8_9BASI|nr:hypothetical protein BCR35DRAFT_299763 [Leucosporidium creatinivorum]